MVPPFRTWLWLIATNTLLLTPAAADQPVAEPDARPSSIELDDPITPLVP